MKKNVMNPENIEPGDIVTKDDYLDGDGNLVEMVVQTVRGPYGNKVYCENVGHELYATCFKLVRKGESCSLCGGPKPTGQSCICFDNNCE